MGHRITQVERGGAGWKAGLRAGDTLERVSGEPIIDEIDYQALTAESRLTLSVTGKDGRAREVAMDKGEGEPLGLHFDSTMALTPRTCHNHCVFCFIDQMPPNLRETLYVKDDDWRLSLMMGNFVTLTNVDDQEFDRILRRRASPLFISVHSTDPALRCQMMNNRFAGDILSRLTRLKDAGLRFHCQIVVCPGLNDGDALMRTLGDLIALAPATQSVAMVPVGLTKFREDLTPVAPFTKETAQKLLSDIAPLQARCRETLGTTLLFPSDEFFCLAGQPVPPDEWYEGYPQIENGVGLLRLLETEIEEAASADEGGEPVKPKTIVIPTGVSACATIRRLARTYAPKGVTVTVQPIVNHFFGERVTVTGLLTGGDVLEQLDVSQADEVLINGCMLRSEQDLFLDDMALTEFEKRLGKPVRVSGSSGQDFYDALRG